MSEQREAKKSSAINQTIAQKVWEGENLGIIKYEGKSYFIHPKSGHPTEIGVSLDTTDSRGARYFPSWFSNYSHTISEAMKAQGIKFSETNLKKLVNDWNITLCEKCTKGQQKYLMACMTAPNSCMGNKGSTKVHTQRMKEMLPTNIQEFRRTLKGQWAKKVIAEVDHAYSRELPADYDFAKQITLGYEPQRVVARYYRCSISKELIKCKEELVLVALVKFDSATGEFYKQWNYASKTAVRKELSTYDSQSELWRAIEADNSQLFSKWVESAKFKTPSSAMGVIRGVDKRQLDTMPHGSFDYPITVQRSLNWRVTKHSEANELKPLTKSYGELTDSIEESSL